MAVSFRVVGTWAELIADGTVAIPATPQAGDRMYLFARWKDFSVTAQVTSPSGWNELIEFADGAVSSGNGTGSVKVGCWYRDWQSGDADPTLDFSTSPTNASVVIIVMSKAAGDVWLTPVAVTAAMTTWTTTSQTVSASSTAAVPGGGVVMGLIGIRDDTATMTRPTTGIDDSTGAVTWNGNYVEAPATHHSTTTGDDGAADLGYRLVTTGATATLRMTGTIAAAETGAALWVVQGVESNLTIQNPAHTHTAANLELSQVHAVSVANASHAQAALSLTLTQVHAITVANANHAQTTSGIALTQVQILVVANGSHSHAAANVVLTQAHALVTQNATHTHLVGSVALEHAHVLTIQNPAHTHIAGSLTIAQVHELLVEDALHAHPASSPSVRSVSIIYLDPGGDAVEAVGFFNADTLSTGLISYDNAQQVAGIGSYKFDSDDGTTPVVAQVPGIMASSGRVSCNFRYDSIPDAIETFSEFVTGGAPYSGVGIANDELAVSDDGLYATATPDRNAGQGSLFSFPLLSVPIGAIVDSVKIIYERKYDVDTSIGVSRVKWVIDDEEGPDHDNIDMPLTDTVVEVDVTADRSWEWQYFQGSRFQVIAEARRGDSDIEHTQSWDYIKAAVEYHMPAGILSAVDVSDGRMFEIAVTPKGTSVVLRFVDGAGDSFDGITNIPIDTWARISYGYVLRGADDLDIKVYVDGIEELSIAGASTAGHSLISSLQYGWLRSPGADHLCWFDQIAIDNGDDLADPGDRRITAKLPASVNEDNWDTVGGTGAVDERPLSETNYMQHAAVFSPVRQTYTLQAADEGDVDLTGKTLVGCMGWIWAKVGAGDLEEVYLVFNGVNTQFATIGLTPSLHHRSVTSPSYPSDAAGIGMVSNASFADTFLLECGVVVAYEGPDISPNRILSYQELTEGTVLDLVDDLRSDPPESYEFCYRSSESETGAAIITVTSLDHDGGNINQQIGEFALNGGSGRSRIPAGVEVQIHIEVIGGPISLGLWHRLNVD